MQQYQEYPQVLPNIPAQCSPTFGGWGRGQSSLNKALGPDPLALALLKPLKKNFLNIGKLKRRQSLSVEAQCYVYYKMTLPAADFGDFDDDRCSVCCYRLIF